MTAPTLNPLSPPAPSQAAAHVVRRQSHDVDDQAEALSDWRQHYEQLGCGRFKGSVWQLVMADGVLLREHTNRQLREQVIPPADHVVLALPLAVAPGSVFAGRPLDRGSLMIMTDLEEYDVVSAGELDLIGLSIHRDSLVASLGPDMADWLARAGRERNLPLAPESASAIRHLLLAVSQQAESQLQALADDPGMPGLAAVGASSQLLAATFNQAVLLAMAGDGVEHASGIPRRADSRLRVVKRAIDFMRANLQNDVGVPEMCAAAFASRRSLQYCFEEYMHTTPQAYLRALRLNEARRALKLRADQAVTSVACALGFSSASHFTRHYKLMFDELPSETYKLNAGGPGVL